MRSKFIKQSTVGSIVNTFGRAYISNEEEDLHFLPLNSGSEMIISGILNSQSNEAILNNTQRLHLLFVAANFTLKSFCVHVTPYSDETILS